MALALTSVSLPAVYAVLLGPCWLYKAVVILLKCIPLLTYKIFSSLSFPPLFCFNCNRPACGLLYHWWSLRRPWEQPWGWQRPYKWLASVSQMWLWDRFWERRLGENQLNLLCHHKKFIYSMDCVALICKRKYNPIFSPFFTSELKIPVWRWQRMMVFMLANTIACIVASVSLNIVDKKQVRISLWDNCPMEAQFNPRFQLCIALPMVFFKTQNKSHYVHWSVQPY